MFFVSPRQTQTLGLLCTFCSRIPVIFTICFTQVNFGLSIVYRQLASGRVKSWFDIIIAPSSAHHITKASLAVLSPGQ